MTTQAVVEQAIRCWGSGEWVHQPLIDAKKETEVLKLNWEKAANQLNWLPAYPWEKAMAQTVEWFKAYQTYLDDAQEESISGLCQADSGLYGRGKKERDGLV